MKNLLLILCIAALTGAASCTESEDITCTNGTVSLGLTGFNRSDVDSAIAIRYRPDNAFDSTVDSARTVAVNTQGDTFYIVPQFIVPVSDPSTHSPQFDKGYDYKVYLPKVARWITISNITLAGNTYQHITHRRGNLLAYGCTNQVKSCNVDGTAVPINSTDVVTKVYVGK